jgi:hypothetical protein
VSEVVRQLTAGSGIEYRDRGSQRLKGVKGVRRRYSVA